MKIQVSVAAYNEISAILERHQIKVGDKELTLEKGTQLSCPIDFRMAVMRRDCLAEAVKIYQVNQDLDISELADKLLRFVAYGETLNKKIDETEPAANKGWT